MRGPGAPGCEVACATDFAVASSGGQSTLGGAAMAENRDPARSAATEDTQPQPWKPPVGATRAGVSGARAAGVRAVDVSVSGYERTVAASAPPPPPAPLAIGSIVGDRYVVEQHISSGGFGAVYRASDRQIRNHQVALKLLHTPAADEQAREAALRELTLIASVSHPSVVQFKDYGWHEGRLWFAMPFYRGETLDQRFGTSGGLTQISRAEARPIFERLAQGLAAMHDVGINHHDIKPENIFLAAIAGFETGLPVLLDLGIASERGEGPKGLTVEYASPETAAAALGKNDRAVGSAADVFSLALVLRNLLEPETAPPVEGELMPLLHKRATEPVPAPGKRELRYLRPAFARWLSLEPGERPTAAQLAIELASLTQPEERREVRARLLRRIVPIVLAAGALVALLLLQVSKQKTQLSVQREALSQQIRQSEELRKRSTEQLQQLEAESQRAGSQDQLLARATANARQFKQLFDKADERGDSLNKKLRKASDERDLVMRERDALLGTRDTLTKERDALLATRDALGRERDALTQARDALEQDRDTTLAQRNDALHQRDRAQADLEAAQKQLTTNDIERESAKNELVELRKQLHDVQLERDRLEAARKALDQAQQQRTTQARQPVLEGRPVQEPDSAGRVRLVP
jgi:serine/threonine protein kinase